MDHRTKKAEGVMMRYGSALSRRWIRFWMRYSDRTHWGSLATRLATWFAPPHKAAAYMAGLNPKGYVVPTARIYHSNVRLGANVYIGDRVLIYQAKDGGAVSLGDRVCILRDTIIETGDHGSVSIGEDAYVHPRCQLNAYLTSIEIGKGVMIAANCAFYPHDHGVSLDRPIREQPMQTKGPIRVGDGAWLGTGVIVLGGVRIGKGAVIGAGAVVTRDVPDNAIAFGVPAVVAGMRS